MKKSYFILIILKLFLLISCEGNNPSLNYSSNEIKPIFEESKFYSIYSLNTSFDTLLKISNESNTIEHQMKDIFSFRKNLRLEWDIADSMYHKNTIAIPFPGNSWSYFVRDSLGLKGGYYGGRSDFCFWRGEKKIEEVIHYLNCLEIEGKYVLRRKFMLLQIPENGGDIYSVDTSVCY